jgi:hypothetical protein
VLSSFRLVINKASDGKIAKVWQISPAYIELSRQLFSRVESGEDFPNRERSWGLFQRSLRLLKISASKAAGSGTTEV